MRELATDRAGLQILHLGDCYTLLGSVPVGRIGFAGGGEVAIAPVTFALDGQDVVFLATAGSNLAGLEIGHYVAFEADSYDPATKAGWSVVVSGLAETVDSPDEVARLGSLGLPRWGGADTGQVWVRIRPTTITGRRTPAA